MPLLSGLSKDELQELMDNEDKINEIVCDQEKVRRWTCDVYARALALQLELVVQ